MPATRRWTVLCLALVIGYVTAPVYAHGARAESAALPPAEILTSIYREAVRGRTSDWLEPQRRGRYLSKSLLALWARVDARPPPEGETGAIDFDITTDTNALELQRFTIRPQAQGANTATLVVGLDYRKPYVRSGAAAVVYDFVRENGAWRIDNIRTRKWTVREMLTLWLKDN